jgi:peptide/nickel transport system permease protein
MTREAQQTMLETFGLDKPVWFNSEELDDGSVIRAFTQTQFVAYVNGLLHGELGISFVARRDVGEILAERVWRTVLLLFAGEVIAIIFGMVIGVMGAWKRGTRFDASILLMALITWAIPTFFLGIILLIVSRGLLPAGGMVKPGLKPEMGMEYWVDLVRHLILPTITIAVVFTGSYIMIMRSSLLEVLTQDYIFAAKAKGLKTGDILRKHALKNAMLPMVTAIALALGFSVGGAIQVETVFSWPGLGRLMFDSVAQQDYPVLQGVFLLVAISVILANFSADIFYSLLDPRIKVE